MRGLFLIIKNSFRNVFKNKFQLIGLILLVALLALVLSLMASINTRVLQSYNSLKSSSNAHNVVLQMDPFDQVETGDIEGSPAPRNLVEAQQYWVYRLQEDYHRDDNNLQFEWSRTEAREFSQVINQESTLTIKTIAKITPQNVYNQNPVDDLVVFEGQKIQSDRQVVIDAVFAKENNIPLGSIIRIQKDTLGDQLLVGSPENKNSSSILFADVKEMEKNGLEDLNGIYQKKYSGNYDWYQVVGYGGSADFLMPVIDSSSVIPNRKTELLVYVNPANFGLKLAAETFMGSGKGLYEYDSSIGKLTVSSNNEWESFYSLKFLDGHTPSDRDIDKMNFDFNTLLQRHVTKKYFYSSQDSSYRYASRTLTMDQTITAYNVGSVVLEILLFIVVFYSIGLVTRKQVEKARGQIGILKALGYSKRKLVFNFVMTPFFTAIVGGILGLIAAGPLSNLITKTFASYFLLDYGLAKFDWWGFFGTLIGLWIILTGIAFLIAYFVLKKDVLTLIANRSKTKISQWRLAIKKTREKAPIGSKISTALFLDAGGKMSVVGIVVLIATMMFTISFAAPDILKRNQTASYSGVKYKQIVEYSDPVYNNPLTFYKTFNHELSGVPPKDHDHVFNHSEKLKAWTALPVDDANNGYNTNQILYQYLTNNIDNEFYSLFLGDAANSGNPPRPDFVISNMRFLAGKDVSGSTDYYRFMASYGYKEKIDFLNQILLNQWPDYVQLISDLKDGTKTLVDNFNTFQKFYSKYVNSIGLSITNDYYADSITPTDSDDTKIQSFNALNKINEVFTTTQSEQTDNFNNQLKALELGDTQFSFTDSSYKLGAFHITDSNNEHNSPEEVNDYYLSLKGETLPETELKTNLVKFILWFGSLFSNRGEQGIEQAAYSRTPYFVQQFFKDAYVNKETYVSNFGIVSYNDQLEGIGTKLQVQANNGKKFKIYGIQPDANRFLDLKNKQSDNLIQDLYGNQEANGIIINQSTAKILNLKAGDSVNLKVLQDELQQANFSDPITLDSWNISNLRNWDSSDSTKNAFTQLNNLDNEAKLKIKTSTGEKELSVKTSILDPNSPTPLYQNVINGNLINNQIQTDVSFKVLGVHDGYGTPQAWIKENDAERILKFDQVKKFNWDRWFASQWGNEFTKDHDYQYNGQNLHFKGLLDLDFTQASHVDYDHFISQYVNSSNPEIADSAQKVLTIFNNSFPIFNYKYSNKDDVGDLTIMVAVHQKFGDYSPIAMQGIRANGGDIQKSYEGASQGAIAMIVPIAISQAILNKISNLVMLILILTIIAILLITFVIILLTSSLIIDDNIKFIATMKVLGYSNNYIVQKVLGMYFIVIATVFVIGFLAGWFIFTAIVNGLVPTIVLPLQFPIWLPFATMLGIVGIYAITLSVGFQLISKTNATLVLQYIDF